MAESKAVAGYNEFVPAREMTDRAIIAHLEDDHEDVEWVDGRTAFEIHGRINHKDTGHSHRG